MQGEYIAWLDGQSVAVGTFEAVESAAIAVFNTPLYAEHSPGSSTLRITRSNARQTLVAEMTLRRAEGAPR